METTGVVVTTASLNFSTSNLIVVDSIEAATLLGMYDNILIHTFTDDITSLTSKISSLKGKNVFYVRDEAHADEEVIFLVEGVGGRFINDEFYLQDAAMVSDLFHQGKQLATLDVTSDLNIIKGYVDRIASNQPVPPKYGEMVVTSANNLVTILEDKNKELVRKSEVGLQIMTNIQSIATSRTQEVEELKKSLHTLEDLLKNQPQTSVVKPTSQRGISLYSFPPITMIGASNLVRIKGVGYPIYLKSFALGYAYFLRIKQNKKAKVIFVVPTNNIFMQTSSYSYINSSNKSDTSLYKSDVVFVDYPVKDVMNKLVSDKSFNVFIVVDLTTYQKNHIIQTNGITLHYSSSLSLLSSLKIKISNTILVVKHHANALGTVPVFQNYPSHESERGNTYVTYLQDLFKEVSRVAKVK